MFKIVIKNGAYAQTIEMKSAWAAQIMAKRYARAYQVTVTKDSELVFANFFDEETFERYGINLFYKYIDTPIIEAE